MEKVSNATPLSFFSIGGSEDLTMGLNSLMDAAIQDAEENITEDIKVINAIKAKMIIKR